ncbi:MAG: hypothetical protein IJY79_02765, partial [Clostridia bacterium]|nr:hypothetical protein [Clostridia bacterium]
MTKKSLSKLLSVILTLAICATTVFGCLMTVNAAENPSYVITGAQCNKNDTAATATVEFTVPDGMISGVFTIDNTDSWYSSVAVSLDSTLNDGDNISIDVLDGVVLFNLTDASDNSVIYTTLTFKLDFVFTTGITSNIDITLSDLDFSSLYEVNYTEFNGTNGVFSVSCEHEYQASGTPVYTDDTNGYEVYSSAVCSLCGEAKEGYQVLPVVQTKEINAVSYSGKVTTVELLDSTQPNSESNPYIITDPGQIFALSRDELKCGDVVVGTNHEYFKVADGIDAFYINGGETVANL